MATMRSVIRLIALASALLSYLPRAACQGALEFRESVLPDIVSISPGDSAVFTINMMPLGVFTGDVNLTVSGLPLNTSATFNPTVINTSNPTSTITITLPSEPLGNDNGHDDVAYTVTVTATSGSIVHSSQVTLSVAKSKNTRVIRRVSFLDQSPDVNIPATALLVPEEDGLYRISGYMVATAADPACREVISGSFTWTDTVGTRTFEPYPPFFSLEPPAWIPPLVAPGTQHISTTSVVLYAKASTPVLFQVRSSQVSEGSLARFSVYFTVEKL